MLISEGKAKYDYSEKQKSTLIENLKRKYNLTEMKDFGSNIILQNFVKTIKAEILIAGDEIQYRVLSLNAL
jgi:DNA-directed RNA polymerase subunit E'/Rpb7